MISEVETLVLLFALTNIYLLGTNRLSNHIRGLMIQGFLLFFFAIFAHSGHLTAHVFGLAAVVLAVKGVVIPWLLKKMLGTTSDTTVTPPPRSIKDDFAFFAQPHVGFGMSIAMGMIFIMISFFVGSKINYLPAFPDYAPFTIPIAMATILSGLLLVVGRMQALSQAIGYLVIENGVFVYGISLSADIPLMVEIGILLDVLGSVMIMGVALLHIEKASRIEIQGEEGGGGHG